MNPPFSAFRLPLRTFALPVFLAAASSTPGQVYTGEDAAPPPAAPNPPSAQASQPSSAGNRGLLGFDLPFLDPGSDIASWDGKAWNIANNRILQARFEKYLNAPEDDSEVDRAYREALDAILEALSPRRQGGPSLSRATALMERAATFEIDARLCDSLLNAVYGVWLSERNVSSLQAANRELTNELRQANWNVEVASERSRLSPPPRNSGGGDQPEGGRGGQTAGDDSSTESGGSQSMQEATRLGTYLAQVAEIHALRTKNKAEMAVAAFQQKVEFQSLIAQFFLQRRFEHVVIACRLYRKLFDDGDGQLQLEKGSEAAKMFRTSLGVNPTINTLDSFANEAIRDVDEGVQSFLYLVERDELDSASKRLAEAFAVGEYLPRVRTLPREEKRKVVGFVRNANQLISALEVKDYGLAGELVERLRREAVDFDYSKANAAVQAAKTVSDMHIQQALLAARKSDDAAVQDNLRKAMEAYPTNPKLQEISSLIVGANDIQGQALSDLDRLISEGNYRTIYKDQARFIAASVAEPRRQEQLREILGNLRRIDVGIEQASRLAETGNREAAWEILERLFDEFPDDKELSARRSDLTTEVAGFVRALRTAKSLEERRQTGSSLAWYLKARQLFPGSEYASDGIQRIVDTVLPDDPPLAGAGTSGETSPLD
ncbi:MAG TPA: hypothetical protein VMN36_10810 [Verrucomicrobiales bacterium]|nr:hypothetical protein [Verrucomicrobiales bacterium]